jgi:hypothetical protein
MSDNHADIIQTHVDISNSRKLCFSDKLLKD